MIMCKRYQINLIKNHKIKNKNSNYHIVFDLYNTVVHVFIELETLKCWNERFFFEFFFVALNWFVQGGCRRRSYYHPPCEKNTCFYVEKQAKRFTAIWKQNKGNGMTTHVRTYNTQKEDSQNSTFKTKGKPETHRKSRFTNVSFSGYLELCGLC